MISLTVPPSSVETVAPCTAETEPTAESTGAQSSSFTGAFSHRYRLLCRCHLHDLQCLDPKNNQEQHTHGRKSFNHYFARRFHFHFSPQRPRHVMHKLAR